jgi:predicted Zn-dependent peptidase
MPWGHAGIPALQLMQELMGSAHAFSPSGSGRAAAAIKDNAFLDGLNGINSNFTDSGLFGVKVTGAGSHSEDLFKVALSTLDGLRNPISESELARAKNNVKMNFMLGMERGSDRLEEVARNYTTHGNLTISGHLEKVDAVTSKDINAAAKAILAGKPTMVVTGGAINLVPSMTDVQRQLK